MKKNFVFGLVLVMMMVFGLISMVGCPTDGTNNNDDDKYVERFVDEKYWGTWKDTENLVDEADRRILTIRKDSLKIKDSYDEKIYSAYTIDDVLWQFYESQQKFFEWGKFYDNETLEAYSIGGENGNMIFKKFND